MKILLAEDEETVSRAICYYLSRHDCDVDAVLNGEDALLYAGGNRYGCIVLDIVMPKMDGLSVLRRLRDEGDQTPVLLLSARADVESRIEGLNAGADDYLCKPFAMGELLARLQAMMRRRDAYVPDVIRFGNIALDQAQRRLCSCSGQVNLSGTEYRLIKLMMRNPRITFSSDALLEHVWSEDSQAKADSVWVYMSCLRKKLKSLDANVKIISRRGVGYMLETESK